MNEISFGKIKRVPHDFGDMQTVMNQVKAVCEKALGGARQIHERFSAAVERKILLQAIEFFLADTCNLHCNQCAASSPYLKNPNHPSLNTFVESLSLLAPIIRCNQLRVLGGEPLLNGEICNFLRAAKQSNIFRNILVVTNGLLLSKMSEEFWQLADSVRISVYPAVARVFTDEKLMKYRKMAFECGTSLEVVKITHFRKAIRSTALNDPIAVKRIFSTCDEAHAWSCYLLYRSRLYRCSRVHTLDSYLGRIGVPHEKFSDVDGIEIDERPTLYKELRNYLRSETPLNACKFCLGTSGETIEHSQLKAGQIRSELEKPASL